MPISMPIADIDQAALQALVQSHTRESQTLEFKRESYGRSDDDIREMLRDISSMSNAFGGDIVLGIEEDSEGAAIKLLGIHAADVEAQRIISSVLSNVDERIPGLVAQIVPLRRRRAALVIRVPRSHRAPHMITFRGLNQFWIRHDRQKSRMSVHEIKDACVRNEQAMENLQRFLEQRQTKMRNDRLQQPRLIVSSTPLFLRQEIVDIRDFALRTLLRYPPDQRRDGWNMDFRCDPIPSIHGLLLKTASGWHSLELFRNGHLELRIQSDVLLHEYENAPYFGQRAIIEYTVSMLRLAKAIYSHLTMSEPLALSFAMLDIKGGIMKRVPNAHPSERTFAWPEQHLELEPITVDSLEAADTAAKRILDRLWQAFGFEEAPLFDQLGNFTP